MNLIFKKWKKRSNKKLKVEFTETININNNTKNYGSIFYPKIIHFKKGEIKTFSFVGKSDSKIYLKIVSLFNKTIIFVPLNTNYKFENSGFYIILLIIPPNSISKIQRIDYNVTTKNNENILNAINNIEAKISELKVSTKISREELNNQINHLKLSLSTFNFEVMDNKSTKTKLLICGFYGGYNLGDELMLQTLLSYLEKNNNLEITVMLADNENYHLDDYKNVRFIHYLKSSYDYVKVSDYYDKIIFGGGALIDDNQFDEAEITLSKLLINLTLKFIYNNKKCYWIGLSSNKELTNTKFIAKLEYIVNHIEYISLRDINSIETLKKSGINVSKIELIHDIICSNEILTKKKKQINKKEKIGIIYICDKIKTQVKIKIITEKLIKYLKANGLEHYEINLIPFYNYQENDKTILDEVKNKLINKRINVLDYENDFNEVVDLINDQDYIITMRYHSLLLSGVLQKNILSIVYDDHPHYENKILYVHQGYNILDNKIWFSSFTNSELTEAFIKLFHNNNLNDINYEFLIESQKQIKKIMKKI